MHQVSQSLLKKRLIRQHEALGDAILALELYAKFVGASVVPIRETMPARKNEQGAHVISIRENLRAGSIAEIAPLARSLRLPKVRAR